MTVPRRGHRIDWEQPELRRSPTATIRSARMDGGYLNGGRGRPPRRPVNERRSPRRALLGLVAALAILVPLVASSTASAAPRGFFGVIPWLEFKGQDYALLQDTKVRNTRTPFFWPAIEPNRGEFRWTATDKFVGEAARVRVRVLPFLNGSPSWVAKDPRRPPLRSKRAKKAWKRFVKKVVKRYGRRGGFWRTHPEIPKVPITALQIWNEMNNRKYFEPRARPKRYAKLVRLARKAANSKNRRAKIVLGGMDKDPDPRGSMKVTKYLRKFYKVKGAKRLFDVLAVHPYTPSFKELKGQIRLMHRIMKRHRDRDPMWITEIGWGSERPSKRKPLAKGIKGQKKMLRKSFRMILNHRKEWRIKRAYWFLWRDPSPNAPVNCSFCPSAGLFRHNFEPKPSYRVFKRFAR
jgi:polysaccharide biosynthesis protein PslG